MDFKEFAVSIVRQAGDIILHEMKDIQYEPKSSYDVVAKADIESEKFIIGKIKENFPSHSILSEEEGDDNKEAEYKWIIDPVDGTVNFTQELPDFCISIALTKNSQTIIGVIYQPLLNDMYVAEYGKGSFLNGEQIHVSYKSSIIDMIGATECAAKGKARRKNFETLVNINDKIKSMRIFGSAALSLARVAAGKLDFYFNNRLNLWDVAAGFLLISEAGGKITDLEGNEINAKSRHSLATHPDRHKELLELLKIN